MEDHSYARRESSQPETITGEITTNQGIKMENRHKIHQIRIW